MEENIEFERCIEFLVRMIEKYGDAFIKEQTKSDLVQKQELQQKIKMYSRIR